MGQLWKQGSQAASGKTNVSAGSRVAIKLKQGISEESNNATS